MYGVFNYETHVGYVNPSILLVGMVLAYSAVAAKHKSVTSAASAIAPESGCSSLEQTDDQAEASSAAPSERIAPDMRNESVPPEREDNQTHIPPGVPGSKSKKRAGERGSSLFIITAITLLWYEFVLCFFSCF